MAKPKKLEIQPVMQEYVYPGYVREDFIRAAHTTSMLNEERRTGIEVNEDSLLKDFNKTIEHLESQGDMVSAINLRDEMARYQ